MVALGRGGGSEPLGDGLVGADRGGDRQELADGMRIGRIGSHHLAKTAATFSRFTELNVAAAR